ncbi:MAG: CBS domain-containing protein [Methanosphaera sp.]|nr:CBS domain-containing protein [Methanosphaera sp.]MBR3214065.1 CBS domain-containing protein [Methanosphaera sp.]
MSDYKKVKDYMTRNVIKVTPDMSISEIKEIIKKTGHDGFPVEQDDKIVGMITASDLLIRDLTPTVSGMMSRDIVIANEELSINDAARVMFRMGISRLPVTNEKRKVLGIITNTDILRSHIERSTPEKVNQFRDSIEQLYDITTDLSHENVHISKLKPTQDKVYADELEGRTYEIERGLAEPIIVVKCNDNKYLVVDGHHRLVASNQMGNDEINAYVITLSKPITLGLEKNAKNNGIHSINDIEIIADAQHPLIAITGSLREKNTTIKK